MAFMAYWSGVADRNVFAEGISWYAGEAKSVLASPSLDVLGPLMKQHENGFAFSRIVPSGWYILMISLPRAACRYGEAKSLIAARFIASSTAWFSKTTLRCWSYPFLRTHRKNVSDS